MSLGGYDSVIKTDSGVWDGWDGCSFEGWDGVKHGVKGAEAWQIHNCVFGLDVHLGALANDAGGVKDLLEEWGLVGNNLVMHGSL